MNTTERFMSKVRVDPETGCWLWTGIPRGTGYGRLRVQGRTKDSHRVSWEIHRGAIPSGVYVLHRCDVRICVNPDHLFLGTQADNLQDAARKGRTARGVTHGRSKLTPELVRYIRTSSQTQVSLAKELGLDFTTVGRARRQETWNHVT